MGGAAAAVAACPSRAAVEHAATDRRRKRLCAALLRGDCAACLRWRKLSASSLQEAAEGLGANSDSDDSDSDEELKERKKASATEGLIETVRSSVFSGRCGGLLPLQGRGFARRAGPLL